MISDSSKFKVTGMKKCRVGNQSFLKDFGWRNIMADERRIGAEW